MLGQRKLLQRLVPGLMHAFIFWGFLVLFPTIVAAAIAAVDKHFEIPATWFGDLVDVFVLLVLAGVVTAVVIRTVVRPARFEGSHRGEGYLILGLIAGVVLTLLCWHAAATAAGLETHAGFLAREFAHASRTATCSSASSSGRTSASSSASSSTCPIRSTCTSRRRP